MEERRRRVMWTGAQLFADGLSDVPPALLRDLLIIGLVVLMVWERVANIMKARKAPERQLVAAPMPQPVMVQEVIKYVEEKDFEELKNDVREIREEMPRMETRLYEDRSEMENRLSAAGEERAKAIHDRINPLATAITGACERCAGVETQVGNMVAIVKTVLRRSPSQGGDQHHG